MALIFNTPSALGNLYGPKLNNFQSMPIELTIKEQHFLNQQVTDKPVEGGAVISDNIILMPAKVGIEGILQGDFFSGITLDDKYNELKKLREFREPFTITTSLEDYDNMFFDGELKIDRDASNIHAIFFTTTLKQINIIESQTTEVPKKAVAQEQDKKGKRSRAAKKNTGKKTAAKSVTEARDKSWIVGLTG